MSTPAFPEVMLRPVLPERHGDRYQLTPQSIPEIDRVQTAIQPFACLSETSSPLPDGWCKFIHPEGNCYYHHADNRILTPSEPQNNDAALMAAHNLLLYHAKSSIGSHQAVLQRLESAELCLRVSPPEPGYKREVVEYYFIDHTARVPFWVGDVDALQLGLSRFSTADELKSQLTIQYWTHVDYYPCHQNIDGAAEVELLSILHNLSIDDSTSPGSTSPYSAAECREYAATLSKLLSQPGSEDYSRAYRMASFARIWGAITRTRHINCWGLQNARLDSNQGVDEYLRSQWHPAPLLLLAEAFCFFAPEAYFKRLTVLWNGRIVYSRRWDAFLDDIRSEWLRMTTFAACIWIANMIRADASEPSVATMATSAFAGAAVAISLALLRLHTKALLSTGPEISGLIAKVEHPKHGLRPLAVVYALPRALTIWAAVAFQSQLLGNVAQMGFHAALACTIPLLSVFFAYGVLG